MARWKAYLRSEMFTACRAVASFPTFFSRQLALPRAKRRGGWDASELGEPPRLKPFGIYLKSSETPKTGTLRQAATESAPG